MASAAGSPAAMQRVCVMDAAGTLGRSLVAELLRRGYDVHAAAAAIDSGAPLASLRSAGCGGRLTVFRSDPLDYKSIVDAIKGCSALFYSFEPDPDAPYDELMVEEEVRAAHNVLEACAQTETVEKVVFTSSVTAVVWKNISTSSSSVAADLDERDWSDPNLCRKFKLWHALAKTMAERTAWALAMDRGVHMVVVNAGLLLAGPHLSAGNPYLKGSPEMYDGGVLVAVDLGFLVDAHVCAMESNNAYGRYLCFNHAVTVPDDALRLSRRLLATAPPPTASAATGECDGLEAKQQRIQNKKLSKLMVDFEGQLSTRDTMEALQ